MSDTDANYGPPSLEEMQQAARFRGVFPPFPENVTKDDLVTCAKYRGIEVTGRETKAALMELLESQVITNSDV